MLTPAQLGKAKAIGGGSQSRGVRIALESMFTRINRIKPVSQLLDKVE